MGGSSPWTRPSAPECGDTLKALAGDQRSSRVGIVLEDGSGVAIDWVTCRSYSSAMYSQANVRAGKVLRPPIRALPSVIVDTEKVLREAWKSGVDCSLRVERCSPRGALRKLVG